MKDSDIVFISKELNLLDATLQSSLRMIGQLRTLIEQEMNEKSTLEIDSPNQNKLLRADSLPIAQIDELGHAPINDDINIEKSSTVDGKEQKTNQTPTKEDVNKLMELAKEKARRNIISKSNELLSQLDHKQQISHDQTTVSTEESSTIIDKSIRVKLINNIVSRFFDSSIIASGTGKIQPTAQLEKYEQNLRSALPKQLKNYPIGFYTNTLLDSTQFLIVPEDHKEPLVIIDNIENAPEIIFLSYTDKGPVWSKLDDDSFTPEKMVYVRNALEQITSNYFD